MLPAGRIRRYVLVVSDDCFYDCCIQCQPAFQSDPRMVLLTDYEPMRKFIFWPVVVTSKYSNSIILIVAVIVLYVAVVSIVCILIDCLMSKVYNTILVKK